MHGQALPADTFTQQRKRTSDGLNKMLNEVRQKTTNDKTLISVEITIPDEGGKPQLYADSMEYKLSPENFR